MKLLRQHSCDSNRLKDDMASAMDMIHNFSNKENESIIAWTEKLSSIKRIFHLTNEDTIKILGLKLKEEASDFYFDYVSKTRKLNVYKIFNALNAKFHNYNKKYIEKGKKDIKDKFLVDEKVLVYKEKMGDKLGTNWNEGYKVVKVLDNDSYIVAKDGRFYRVHTRFLKRAYF